MRVFLFLSILLFAACNNSSDKGDKAAKKIQSIDTASEGGSEITCWGIGDIDLDNDMQSLTGKVGKANVTQDSLFKEGSFEGFVTTLWKGSPKEIIVHWKEKKEPYQTIDHLEITSPESPYHFVNGIKIGTTLKEMEKLNGGTAISLYGFGWDYGGTFISFNKGKLAGDIPCFGGVFALPENVETSDTKDVMGDSKISSSHAAFTKYDPKLVTIRVKN
ncbi:hypothetical protein [Arcticibacter tournemirensis]|uniref:Lipoprotein n=1 Tax=Arcticibacter tournemirensis TaxID=699437 RepID=A0A4Q0M9N3_9SPHI|nr:hypothetical protein [Arcticibacter tournemirensis]RXF69795.1 hypothetical protein EKH83_11130 [Arcticibacter tournemirensis]